MNWSHWIDWSRCDSMKQKHTFVVYCPALLLRYYYFIKAKSQIQSLSIPWFYPKYDTILWHTFWWSNLSQLYLSWGSGVDTESCPSNRNCFTDLILRRWADWFSFVLSISVSDSLKLTLNRLCIGWHLLFVDSVHFFDITIMCCCKPFFLLFQTLLILAYQALQCLHHSVLVVRSSCIWMFHVA